MFCFFFLLQLLSFVFELRFVYMFYPPFLFSSFRSSLLLFTLRHDIFSVDGLRLRSHSHTYAHIYTLTRTHALIHTLIRTTFTRNLYNYTYNATLRNAAMIRMQWNELHILSFHAEFSVLMHTTHTQTE